MHENKNYDAKIYFDIIINGDLYSPIDHVRIIDVSLETYYDCEIEYLCDAEGSMLTVGIKKGGKERCMKTLESR